MARNQTLNAIEDVEDLMTEQERAALKSLEDEGFDLPGTGDEFSDDEMSEAAKSVAAREKAEAEAAGDAPDAVPEDQDDDPAAADPATAIQLDAAQTPAAVADAAPAETKTIDITQEVLQEAMAEAAKLNEAEIKALSTQFSDGVLDEEEFSAELKKIQDGQAARVTEQISEVRFQFTVRDFLTANPALNSDAHLPGLNAELGAIDANPLFNAMNDADKLSLAHERYNQTLDAARARGLTVPDTVPVNGKQAAPKPDDTAQAQPKPAEAPKAAKPQPPQTLARLPASDPTGTRMDNAARQIVDSKDPDAIEDAIMRGVLTEDALMSMSG
jgi:hypothetical protein